VERWETSRCAGFRRIVERRERPIQRRDVVLPVHHDAGRLARAALDDAIPPPALDGRTQDARLAVTELVSNAVRHAGLQANTGLIHLRIEADDDHVRVEVEQDTSARGAHIVDRAEPAERAGGFGLRLVEASADAWGVEPGPPGKVWCEFRP
jgi:signal transduction histidine kinase